ncbi:hypothetical protein P152DRAFT_5104 [Eremomyces bilateralis CBS 781.70]|uniref:Uncharacterized protein n=1 Tax=Eremomyces bilateralis CBS 781.70 TaxID=1392243 RepID=A0A6G1GG12_9PEZI|nr:uncharacterized protein P152DRAFT_5104 [Eremomyces bilateralis CBS 781.70]KAF1816964.1 hypothetical protein P152DRAFT_5104 [Eremomyces bilateralis CBS 781.70]
MDVYLRRDAQIYVTTTKATYAMAFHLPYYALRKGSEKSDRRKYKATRLRRSYELPLPRKPGEKGVRYYEAEVSGLTTGVDDFFYTTYCFVDTYFGSEELCPTYLDRRTDPLTAIRPLDFPVWNPRENYILPFSRRLRQVTEEQRDLINEFDDRMEEYTRKHFSPFHDRERSDISELRTVVATVTCFRKSTIDIISAWDRFAANSLGYFEGNSNNPGTKRWEEYIADLKSSVSELSFLRDRLEHRYHEFHELLQWMLSGSVLHQNQIANQNGQIAMRQEANIRLLAQLNILFLPLHLITAAFSMNMVPNSASWLLYLGVLIGSSVLTYFCAFNPWLHQVLFEKRRSWGGRS